MFTWPQGKIYTVVLGIMQDAGLPHIGCRCARCAAAFADPRQAEYTACLAIVDARQQPAAVWLIDATPDINRQLNLLATILGAHPTRPERLRQPDGIFLTHGHMGHVAGLAQLGPEAMFVQALPVHAPAGLVDVLQATAIWRPLLANCRLLALEPERPVTLAPELTLTPLPVPHRDEWGAGTFAYRLQGPRRSLLYLPDIDAWEPWPAARQIVAGVDVALVDGAFFSRDELGGRDPVAHPLVPQTLNYFSGSGCRLLLTHLNHTNPVLDKDSPARRLVVESGAAVAHTGQVISL